MNDQLQLVTFEQAKRLKELRFNWVCTNYYDKNKNLINGCENVNNNVNFIWSCPSIVLALKWFRDVKKVIVCIFITVDGKYAFSFIPKDRGEILNFKYFDTYEQVESTALDYLLNLKS